MADALDGKVVGVQRGTIHQDFMEGVFPGVELRLYGSQDDVYLDLQAGRIDAAMGDSIAMDDGFLSTDAGADFGFFGEMYAVPQYHGEGAGVGVRQADTELRDAFSAAILAIRASGEYASINDQYFEIDIYGGE